MRTRAVLVSSCLALGSILGCASTRAELPSASGLATLRQGAALALDGAMARSIDVRDSIAAVGCGDDGLFLVDVSDPDTPTLLAHVPGLDASAVAFGTDGLVVASAAPAFGGSTRLQIVDVLDPRQPIVGAPFAATFDAASPIGTESGSIAVVRRRDGPLVTDEHRLELASVRAVVQDGIDDAVLLRRGWLFVHATTARWRGDDSHRIVIADVDRGEPRDTIPLQASAAGSGALGLIGDDLLCAGAEQVDVIRSVTTAARRHGAPIDVAGVRRIAVDGASAALLAAAGAHVVLVEPQATGEPGVSAALELEVVGQDVAMRGREVFVAAGAAGLVVVYVEGGSTP